MKIKWTKRRCDGYRERLDTDPRRVYVVEADSPAEYYEVSIMGYDMALKERTQILFTAYEANLICDALNNCVNHTTEKK